MAVISAAVAAVATAVSTIGAAAAGTATIGAAVAATAAATVAVSTVIGVAGLAVTAVGMVTKNQGLLKAGKIMGYVGLAGSVAGGLTGGFTEGFSQFGQRMGDLYKTAWDEGVGSFFTPDAGSSAGALSTPQAAPTTGGVDQFGNTIPTHQPYQGEIGAIPQPDLAPSVATSADDVGLSAPLGNTPTAPTPHPSAVISSADQSYTAQQVAANAGPPAPVAPGPPSLTGPDPFNVTAPLSSSPTMGPMDTLKQLLPGVDTTKPGWFGPLTDSQKTQLAIIAGQAGAGLAGGWFQGLSAEERLEFDKLVNAQRQAQVDLQNRNAAYAPRLRFNGPTGPAGLINRRMT